MVGSGGREGHTYWFIKLVLPTPLSPRMMTLSRIFLRDDMVAVGSCALGRGCGAGWKARKVALSVVVAAEVAVVRGWGGEAAVRYIPRLLA